MIIDGELAAFTLQTLAHQAKAYKMNAAIQNIVLAQIFVTLKKFRP